MTTMRSRLRQLAQTNTTRVCCAVEVVAIERISLSYSRVTVHADELAGYVDPMPADAVKLMLPPRGFGSVDVPNMGPDGMPQWGDGPRPPMRAYTVRRFDPVGNLLEIDVLRHAAGLAVEWLMNASVGDQIGLMAVRRDFALGDESKHLAIVADPSAVPAAAAILDSLPRDLSVTAVLQVPVLADECLVPHRPNTRIRWVNSDYVRYADEAILSNVEGMLPRDGSQTQFWIAAEAGTVASLRELLSARQGIGRDNLHAIAYWKRARTSDERDARIMARFATAMSDGIQLHDPDVRERLEIEADGEA